MMIFKIHIPLTQQFKGCNLEYLNIIKFKKPENSYKNTYFKFSYFNYIKISILILTKE